MTHQESIGSMHQGSAQHYPESGLGARTMSVGEARVRVSFNPSQSGVVNDIKSAAAALIDNCEAMKKAPEGAPAVSGEKARCCVLAQTAYEEACMWHVKAATA